MLKKSKELFDFWNCSSLRYCHWKGNEHLVEGLNGDTDLDVLLDPMDKEKGCSILEEIGFVKFHSQFGSRYPNVEDWIGFDVDTGRLLHLHLHYALQTGHTGLKEYALPWADEALETRIQDKKTGIYTMNPHLELVSLYTRLILKAKHKWIRAAKNCQYKINNHFQKEIDFIKKRVDWHMVEIIALRYYGSLSGEFVEIVKSDRLDSQQFLRLYFIVNKTMSNYSRYHGLSLFVLRIFYSATVFMRKVVRQRIGWNLITRKVVNPEAGFTLALIGQDGCGKSTVTTEIEKWLNWKIDARRFYLGSGDHYNGLLKQLLNKGFEIKYRNKKKDIQKEKKGKRSQTKRKKNLKNFFPAILVALNMLIIARRAYKTIKKSEVYRKKGGISLFDRYPQLQYEGIYDGPKIASFYRKTGLDYVVLKWMSKKERSYIEKIQQCQPRLVFKLMLPPEESIRRKPFEKLEIVTQKHEITQQLIFDHSIVYDIDATQDYQQELIFIKNQIWKEIQKSHIL